MSRSPVAALAIAGVLVAAAPAAAASPPPCTPTPFDTALYRVKKGSPRVVDTFSKAMQPSRWMHNGSTLPSTYTVSYGRSGTWSGTFSTGVEVGFNVFGNEVKATVGFAIERSKTVERSESFELTIPAGHYGWFVPVARGATITAVQERFNLRCKKVVGSRTIRWTGPRKELPNMAGRISRTRPAW